MLFSQSEAGVFSARRAGARRWWCLLALLACERTGEASVARAQAQARELVEMSARDAAEVRTGLPPGAQEFGKRWVAGGVDLTADPEAARQVINQARNKVQDLRVAKSTFFALADLSGKVIRNDREQDLMAGTALFPAFPALANAAKGGYVEALGVLPEAHGVKGKPDSEWMAAVGIDVGGQVKGLFVTGWAWSSYAFRLEFALRNRETSELMGKRENMPLLYAFVLVEDRVIGSPESPEVNAQAIGQLQALGKLDASGAFSTLLEITGRQFALGVQAAPQLAPGVALGVLRSET